MKQMIRIHNIETNEVIDREMTEEEIAELEQKNLKMSYYKPKPKQRQPSRLIY